MNIILRTEIDHRNLGEYSRRAHQLTGYKPLQ
jgi:hypothetical protein